MPAGSAIEPLDRSHRLAPFEVFTTAASTELLWRHYRSFYRTIVEAVGVRGAGLRLLVRAFDALIMLATID